MTVLVPVVFEPRLISAFPGGEKRRPEVRLGLLASSLVITFSLTEPLVPLGRRGPGGGAARGPGGASSSYSKAGPILLVLTEY